jgi:hypothetical protein
MAGLFRSRKYEDLVSLTDLPSLKNTVIPVILGEIKMRLQF